MQFVFLFFLFIASKLFMPLARIITILDPCDDLMKNIIIKKDTLITLENNECSFIQNVSIQVQAQLLWKIRTNYTFANILIIQLSPVANLLEFQMEHKDSYLSLKNFTLKGLVMNSSTLFKNTNKMFIDRIVIDEAVIFNSTLFSVDSNAAAIPQYLKNITFRGSKFNASILIRSFIDDCIWDIQNMTIYNNTFVDSGLIKLSRSSLAEDRKFIAGKQFIQNILIHQNIFRSERYDSEFQTKQLQKYLYNQRFPADNLNFEFQPVILLLFHTNYQTKLENVTFQDNRFDYHFQLYLIQFQFNSFIIHQLYIQNNFFLVVELVILHSQRTYFSLCTQIEIIGNTNEYLTIQDQSNELCRKLDSLLYSLSVLTGNKKGVIVLNGIDVYYNPVLSHICLQDQMQRSKHYPIQFVDCTECQYTQLEQVRIQTFNSSFQFYSANSQFSTQEILIKDVRMTRQVGGIDLPLATVIGNFYQFIFENSTFSNLVFAKGMIIIQGNGPNLLFTNYFIRISRLMFKGTHSQQIIDIQLIVIGTQISSIITIDLHLPQLIIIEQVIFYSLLMRFEDLQENDLRKTTEGLCRRYQDTQKTPDINHTNENLKNLNDLHLLISLRSPLANVKIQDLSVIKTNAVASQSLMLIVANMVSFNNLKMMYIYRLQDATPINQLIQFTGDSVAIADSLFINIELTKQGVLSTESATYIMIRSSIFQNILVADQSGSGGIGFFSGASFQIEMIVFINDLRVFNVSASKSGGCFYWIYSPLINVKIIVQKVIATQISASSGSFIYFEILDNLGNSLVKQSSLSMNIVILSNFSSQDILIVRKISKLQITKFRMQDAFFSGSTLIEIMDVNHTLMNFMKMKNITGRTCISLMNCQTQIVNSILSQLNSQVIYSINGNLTLNKLLISEIYAKNFTANGTFQFITTNLQASQIIFKQCSGFLFGGGLYLEHNSDQLIQLIQIKFINITAQYGDCICRFSKSPISSSIQEIIDIGRSHQPIFQFPDKLALSLTFDDNQQCQNYLQFKNYQSNRLQFRNIRKGANVKVTISLYYKFSIGNDKYKVYPFGIPENSINLMIYETERILFNSMNNQQFSLRAMTSLKYTKNTSNVLKLDFTNIMNQFSYPPFITEFVINVSFRQCKDGEIKFDAGQVCEPCSDNKYSYDRQSCKPCDPSWQCSNGTINQIGKGLWRLDSRSDTVMICENAPLNCQGGKIDHQCASGTIGPLCETCDHFGIVSTEFYFRESGYQCQKCSNKYRFTFIGIILISDGLQLLLLRIANNGIFQIIQVHYIRQMGLIPIGVSGLLQLSGAYINLIRNHQQIYSMFSQSSKQSGDVFIQEATKMMDSLNFISIQNGQPDCELFKHQEISEQYPFYILLLCLGFTFQLLCFLVFAEFILRKFYKGRLDMNILIFILIQQYLSFYPSISNITFSLLSCRLIGNKTYLSTYLIYRCKTQEHLLYNLIITLPVMLIIIFLLPIILLHKVRKAYTQKKEMVCLNGIKYGLLISDFRQNRYYFELVRIYLKILMQFGASILSDFPRLKLLITIQQLLIYQVILNRLKPFFCSILFTLDRLSNQILISTFLMSLILLESLNSLFLSSVQALIILANFIFIIYSIIRMAIQLSYDNNLIISKLLQTTMNKHLCAFQQVRFKTIIKWKQLSRKLPNTKINFPFDFPDYSIPETTPSKFQPNDQIFQEYL